MRFFILFLIVLSIAVTSFGQDVKFALPLKGVPGKDFFIVAYVDHDTTSDFEDVFCGSQTYDGHTGTDFSLRSFKTMDSGVFVYAAADGRVFYTKDNVYDRSKRWNGGGLGNHVVIKHSNGLCTYYGHLMNHSLMVKVGDSVKSGQPLGKVGSSGMSNGPHVHFQVTAEKDKERKIIDPFTGGCRPDAPSLWLSQPARDTAVYAIDYGFVPYIPKTDTLKERYLVIDTFYTGKNDLVCFWVLMHGLFIGDNIRVEWYTPSNFLWSVKKFRWKGYSWCDYSWTYITIPEKKGRWLAKYFVNNELIASRNFYVLTYSGSK